MTHWTRNGFVSMRKPFSSLSFPHALSGNPEAVLYSGSPTKTFRDDNLKHHVIKALTGTYQTVSKIIIIILASGMFLTLSPGARAEENTAGRVTPPAPRFFLGEKIKFEISYLGIVVGDAAAEVKEVVPVGRRQAYHIVVEVRSRGVLNWIYKVRDTHHSYVDTEHFHSLRYEKNPRRQLLDGRIHGI